MSDQCTIPPKSTQVIHWVSLELLTEICVRGYLQKLKTAVTKNPIPAWVTTHKTWEPGVQGTACRHLSGLERVPSRKLLVSSFLHSSSCLHFPQVIWQVWAIQSLSAAPYCLEKEGPRDQLSFRDFLILLSLPVGWKVPPPFSSTASCCYTPLLSHDLSSFPPKWKVFISEETTMQHLHFTDRGEKTDRYRSSNQGTIPSMADSQAHTKHWSARGICTRDFF